MRYRFENMTLTQLGEIFGVSSHQVGNWLVEIGFRTENKRPSNEAFKNNVVTDGPSRGVGTYNWVWNSEKTIAALEAAGHKRVFPAPIGLIEPPKLIAPFALKATGEGNFQIENGEGEPILLGQNEESCKLLLRILVAAARTRVVSSILNL